MMKTSRSSNKLRGFCAAASLFAATLASTAIYSYAAEIAVPFSSVSITTDGDCSWSMGDSGALTVDKYELKLSRKSSGIWSDNYKTVKTSDDSYSFTFTSKGQYKYKIRALFVGGDKSTWSGESNTVSVTSDDVSHGEPGSGAIYVPTTGSDGNTYYVPAGPGSNYTYTTTTIGPDGSVKTTTYDRGGSNTQIGPGGVPINTTNQSQSGWIRNGNKWIYRYANGTQPKNSWDRIDGKWYHFDANGFVSYGWVADSGKWYYTDINTGAMKTGFNNVNEKWYYFNESGIMQTGYVVVNGKTYYMDQSGARLDSGYNPDGHQFDVNGIMIK
ncbi:MAG: hypothetical protein Q4P22_07660 [Eubacteriales bacterium]|nr:hypothetical protein [Eubacteriales bacterium]